MIDDPNNPRAFPVSGEGYSSQHYTQHGMTLWDYFAGQVVMGMVAFSGTQGAGYGPGELATRSGEIADAMLAERAIRAGGPVPFTNKTALAMAETWESMAFSDTPAAAATLRACAAQLRSTATLVRLND